MAMTIVDRVLSKMCCILQSIESALCPDVELALSPVGTGGSLHSRNDGINQKMNCTKTSVALPTTTDGVLSTCISICDGRDSVLRIFPDLSGLSVNELPKRRPCPGTTTVVNTGILTMNYNTTCLQQKRNVN